MADVPADLAAVWPRVLEQLLGEGRGQGVEVKDEHWIRRCQPLALVADTALLAVPNEFAKGVLEGRLAPIVSETLSRECGRPIRIAITVDDSVGEPPAPPSPSAQQQSRYEETELPVSPTTVRTAGTKVRGTAGTTTATTSRTRASTRATAGTAPSRCPRRPATSCPARARTRCPPRGPHTRRSTSGRSPAPGLGRSRTSTAGSSSGSASRSATPTRRPRRRTRTADPRPRPRTAPRRSRTPTARRRRTTVPSRWSGRRTTPRRTGRSARSTSSHAPTTTSATPVGVSCPTRRPGPVIRTAAARRDPASPAPHGSRPVGQTVLADARPR